MKNLIKQWKQKRADELYNQETRYKIQQKFSEWTQNLGQSESLANSVWDLVKYVSNMYGHHILYASKDKYRVQIFDGHPYTTDDRILVVIEKLFSTDIKGSGSQSYVFLKNGISQKTEK